MKESVAALGVMVGIAVVVIMTMSAKAEQTAAIGDPNTFIVVTAEQPVSAPTEIDGTSIVYVDSLENAEPDRRLDLVIPGIALLLLLYFPLHKLRERDKIEQLSPEARSAYKSVQKYS